METSRLRQVYQIHDTSPGDSTDQRGHEGVLWQTECPPTVHTMAPDLHTCSSCMGYYNKNNYNNYDVEQISGNVRLFYCKWRLAIHMLPLTLHMCCSCTGYYNN